MRISQEPLNSAETDELSQLLKKSEARGIEFARGVFAAVATSPTQMDPTEWMPLVLGPEELSASELKRALTLLMRECNACAECLVLGHPAVPPPEQLDAIHQYTRGFMQVAGRDAAWKADTDSFSLAVPLMALSGYADVASLTSIEATKAHEDDAFEVLDEEQLLTKYRSDLVDHVAGLYDHFKETRNKKTASATVAGEDKVGRNEPCPCGSGRKWKKCCGAGS